LFWFSASVHCIATYVQVAAEYLAERFISEIGMGV